MRIWNVDAQQRQRHLTWAESCYIMSVSNKLSYLLVIIMLLSQDRITIIFTVKSKVNNITFNTKYSFECQSNWNMDKITPLGYAINICIFYRVCFGWHCYFVNDLVAYNQANFHQPTTLSWRDIAFRIWCLPCNSHWGKWPKPFFFFFFFLGGGGGGGGSGVDIRHYTWMALRKTVTTPLLTHWSCGFALSHRNLEYQLVVVQYIPRIMYSVCALLCFVVFWDRSIYRYPAGLGIW